MSQLKDTLYVLFGSRTGNAKSVAVLAHEYALSLGYEAILLDMQELDYSQVKTIKNLLVIVSTHGEGEPPVQAEGFYDFLHSDAMDSVKAQFAVLGLGDSSYRYFCQTGEDIHKRLEELGSRPVMEHAKCDIDFEETAKQWVLDVFQSLDGQLKKVNPPNKEGFTFELKIDGEQHSAYKAELLEKKLLTSETSSKKVLHVSLSLKNSGIDYLPGDAIGVYGTNSRALVDELLTVLNFDKACPVPQKETTRLLKDVLINDYELTLVTPLVIKKYAEIVQVEALNQLVQDDKALEAYSSEKDIMDLVLDYPGHITVEQFLSVLRKLSQRLYSVSSSKSAVNDQADIVVKVIENNGGSRVRNGVCSSFLWSRLDEGDMVPVTLETIAKFRLPDDNNAPVIMIGAGTGIAPFRGFIQERKARSAKGMNWLFFGERNSESDFLYKDELMAFQKDGALQQLSTAFSRDQKEKRYVSHLIEENGREILEWIEKGAVTYVCGSKDQLAVTVRSSFIKAISQHKQMNESDALTYFEGLKGAKKYQEEVY